MMKYISFSTCSGITTRALVAIVVLLLLALCVPGVVVTAQELDTEQVICSTVAPVGDLVVGRREQSQLEAKPGETFSVALLVSNSFPYELKDVDLTAALYKEGSAVPQDWMRVEQDMNLAPGAQAETILEWNIPRNLPAGNYVINVFAVQGSDADALLDVVGRTLPAESFPVSVTGEAVPSGYFDLNSVTVNGESVGLGSTYQFSNDAEMLEVSVDLVNTNTEMPFKGPLSITVYEGFYPDPDHIVESESMEGRLISGVDFTKTISFKPHFDRYLVVGQFTAEDGSRSSFVLPLERTDFTSLMWPTPAVALMGLVESEQAAPQFVGCLGHVENPFLPTGWVTPSIDVEYILSVHNLLEGGAVADGEPIKTFTAKGAVGGGIDTLGFTQDLGDVPDQFAVRLVLKRGEEVLDTREVRYACNETRPCEQPAPEPVVESGSALMQFIEATKNLIENLRLLTWVILVGVSIVFIMTLRPFLKRSRKPKAPSSEAEKPKEPLNP